MPNIFYRRDKHGRETGKWPGVSKRVEVTREDGSVVKEPRKEGQMYLGLVVDKEANLFYNNDLGFFIFYPENQRCEEISPNDLPVFLGKKDGRRRNPPVVVLFGGSFFLDCLIKGIQYTEVINAITYQVPDRLYTVLQYYLLCPGPANRIQTWYECNYVKFLYPMANPGSQRISDFYETVGRDENRRAFLLKHIQYLLKATGEELCILIDSAGCPNKCEIPYTRVSNHDGDVNIEFRVILVVQKKTGLPVYYEMIPGNVVDSSTIMRVIRSLKQLGYNVDYALGDAAYSCPANLERLILSGIDFLTRLNPAYPMYKEAMEAHKNELNDQKNDILFHGRVVTVVKIPTTIATDKETKEEKQGYIYLCRDHNAWHSKSTHFMNSRQAKKKTHTEISAICDRFGVFALVSSKEISANDVLVEYYMRQAVEQFFDFAKNYANFLPVRNQKVETLKGHLLLGFMATFFLVLIKNKLNILDSEFVAIPNTLQDEMSEETYVEVDTQQGVELMIRQEKQMAIYKSSPEVLFSELQFQMADVYEEELEPTIPVANASQMYKAFHIGSPEYVIWDAKNRLATPIYKENEGNNCTKRIAFARKSLMTTEEIEEKRRKGELKKLSEMAEKHGKQVRDADSSGTNNERQNIDAESGKTTTKPEVKRGRGRPAGSKNKKTLEREAREAAAIAAGIQPVKRGRGRPIGSKNKKTIERIISNKTNG